MPSPLCPDCEVPPGQLHDDGCDVARCSITGGQRLLCEHPAGDCRTAWSGVWPSKPSGGTVVAGPPSDSIPAFLSPGGPVIVTLVFHGGPLDGRFMDVERPVPVPEVVEVEQTVGVGQLCTYERFTPDEYDGDLHYEMTAWRPRGAASEDRRSI